MADIALRSPQFKHKEIPATGVLSSVCTVKIDGTLRYTLTKNVEASTSVNFDISELARDYLEIEYKGNFHAQYVDIVTTIKNYSLVNGGGVEVGTETTYTDRGFEAYGTFTENSNPLVYSTRPRFLNCTTSSIKACVPIKIFISPERSASCKTFRSFVFVLPVSNPI